jgi:uncharacterized protein
MPTACARIRTDRASRYLVHLCKHAVAMGVSAEWSAAHGVISFGPRGRCTLDATGDALVLTASSDDSGGLRRIQDIITADLGRFGRRDGLTVTWRGRLEHDQGGGGHADQAGERHGGDAGVRADQDGDGGDGQGRPL